MQKLISLILTLCFIFAVAAFAAPDQTPKSAQAAGKMAAPTKGNPTKAISDNQTYIRCYFGTPDSYQREWGLTATNDYYVDTGSWSTTQFTGDEKYFTSTPQSTLQQACMQSKAYYGITAPLFAFFAATSNPGGDYPIVDSGVELYPNY